MRYGILVLIVMLLMGVSSAEEAAVRTSIDDFLRQVQQQSLSERDINREREQEFSRDLNAARQQVAQARERLAREQQRQERLASVYDANEARLITLEEALREQQGNLGEIFGVVRQNAGDFHAQFLSSLAMANRHDDLEYLRRLSNSRTLPSIAQIERMWLLMLQEMADSGKVVSFASEIVSPDGHRQPGEVLRVGAFNAIANGRYLTHVEGRNQFVELPRQPQNRYLRMASRLENGQPGQTFAFAVDPSRGAILSQLVQSPSLTERVRQGRAIGVIILVLGAFGLGMFALRYTWLHIMGRRISHQMEHRDDIHPNNPLGRILALYEENRETDVETMELRLDEEILREVPRLEWGLTTIKILAAVAPLLGLLGTVVGMIETFQAITLFGTGDPQLMAGGISQALVTTALGLVVAIPLLFLHNLATAKSRALINTMEEQGAGLLAMHMARGRGEAHA
ncbi:MotA/TolQ/ExbB proton channel family protein [Desulfurispirillum indicum]|uniref:MotA/TolQ/ExbB proton channel family protein n=1 Tax=Desulfurispirillum indicum TaxID=936456 RepID=UPI001CFB041E|nr:MotA/TolQ/ExbB proton channel family protein [Desulfurispirillum indicum]UCZ55974.1 MotA/TolQ/ExbB proton channel family protein [Desulfurispirillum indicum]